MAEDTAAPQARPTKTFIARPALRSECRVWSGIAFVALLVIVWFLLPERITKLDWQVVAVVPAFLWLMFMIPLALRIRLATSTLRVSGDGLEVGTFGIRRRRVPWSEIDAVSFRSRQAAAERAVGAVLVNVPLNVVLLPLGVAGFVGLKESEFVADASNNPFAGPGPARDQRVPMAKFYGRDRKRLLSLDDAFGWDAYDCLIAELLERDVVVFTDRLQIERVRHAPAS